ncbi:MAG: hypothetical protein ACRES3_03410 [Steroidobacteraceae bacterium]
MLSCQLLELALALGADAGPTQAPQQAGESHQHDRSSAMTMTGALGSYPMSRDASGTAWQPDDSPHVMGHTMRGDWTLMGHAMLNAVYDRQQGPRGDELAFVAGMAMGTARRGFANGDALTLRAMLSPDPFMGRKGYPLLLAAGETADGATPLVDRQHPHELIMELSATYARRIGDEDSIFLYAGLPGEPAFGPPAFMHRLSAMDSPEAPITHHWLDSTHISFGVITAGWVRNAWKLEASRFTGREPDEDRFDIESPRLDSTAVRASWNPAERWSLQVSRGDIEGPEQLEPDVDETRWSASATYAVAIADDAWWSTTMAWGRKDPSEGDSTQAVALESAYAPGRDWTLFARVETVETHELGPAEEVHSVGKFSFGARRDFRLTDRLRLGIGALYSINAVADELKPSYGGDPDGAMVFLSFGAGT